MKRITVFVIAAGLALAACGSGDKDNTITIGGEEINLDDAAKALEKCTAALDAGDVFDKADSDNCTNGGVTMTWDCEGGSEVHVLSLDDVEWAYRTGAAPMLMPKDKTMDDIMEICP